MFISLIEEFDLNDVVGHENYDYMMLLDRIEEKMNKRKEDKEGTRTEESVQIVTRIVSIKTSWF